MSLQVVEPIQEPAQLQSLITRLDQITAILADRYHQGIYYTRDLDPEIDQLHARVQQLRGAH